jgi:hypothetical protein
MVTFGIFLFTVVRSLQSPLLQSKYWKTEFSFETSDNSCFLPLSLDSIICRFNEFESGNSSVTYSGNLTETHRWEITKPPMKSRSIRISSSDHQICFTPQRSSTHTFGISSLKLYRLVFTCLQPLIALNHDVFFSVFGGVNSSLNLGIVSVLLRLHSGVVRQVLLCDDPELEPIILYLESQLEIGYKLHSFFKYSIGSYFSTGVSLWFGAKCD